MFADRLKKVRKEAGYTQESLAQALGVSKGTVAMWETGKRNPDFEMLCDISDLLDRKVDYLLDHSDDDSSPRMTPEQIDQLGRWELESRFVEALQLYMSLDNYGQATVDNVLRSERLRCHDQGTISDVSSIKVVVHIQK